MTRRLRNREPAVRQQGLRGRRRPSQHRRKKGGDGPRRGGISLDVGGFLASKFVFVLFSE